MNVLSVENLTKSFGDRLIFADLTFGMDHGDKMAIVAKNGSGKSTLLKCLLGKESVDQGKVVFRKDYSVAFMEQAEDLNPDLSILDAVFDADIESLRLLKEYNDALAHNDLDEIQRLTEIITNLDLWDTETKVKQILSVLKIDEFDKKVRELSGGQKKRVSLAQVLISGADFLILDEPTNHLDLDMIEWLEDHLSKTSSTLLMVTHDRYFLEVVCDHILELDDETLFKYKGNFSYYLEKKAERQEQMQSTIDKARNQFKKELDWIRRQPKARGTKQKARIDAFHETKKVASQRLDEDEMDIPVKMERLGTKIVELHKVGKSFPNRVILDKFDYHFKRKERLGIVGQNGTGKSTFLKLITGETQPDAGKIVIGETVKFGYYSQDLLETDNETKVIDVIREIAEFIPLEKGRQLSAAQLLEKFLFPRSMHYQYVYKLSGGEKRRLKLLTILMANPNFLILDEPTNDLDIFVMSVLEDYLKSFEGCLIVVSHDRYFMDKMVDHLFVFEGQGEVKDIIGNYTLYRKNKIAEQRALNAIRTESKLEKTVEKPIQKESSSGEKRKLSFKEKMELEQIEKDLETLEQDKEKFTAVLSNPESDSETLTNAGIKLKEIMDAIDTKTERWMELVD
ncbi:MAG: ABC-F family ATP-binding cassette domain-containing protein [Crocinitomicaceae bacterium]|jgi:ATP-binding cassette subfamily F protein uup|nr:ABC-F family ATP-binding cassette domain-containing protein [Crocinitomicaceae bacterium]